MRNQQIICKNIERISNSYIITAIAAVKQSQAIIPDCHPFLLLTF